MLVEFAFLVQISLSAGPELRIGNADQDNYSFSEIVGGVIDSRDRIWVADRLAGSLFVYDRTGKFTLRIARSGSGPGEFSRLGAVGVRGDTIWAVDFALLRATYFSLDGKVLRTRNTRAKIFGQLFATGLTQSDYLIGEEAVPAEDFASGRVVAIPLLRWKDDATAVDTIEMLDRQNFIGGTRIGGMGFRSIVQPFQHVSLYAVDTRGGIAVVHQTLELLQKRKFKLLKFSPDGILLWSRDFSFEPVPLTTRLIQQTLNAFSAGLKSVKVERSAAADLERDHEAQLYKPPFLPPVTKLFVASNGDVWIRRENDGRSLARWMVIDPQGKHHANVTLPSRALVLSANRVLVLAADKQAFDYPTVIRFRLENRQGPH